jgi:hypothetical protein
VGPLLGGEGAPAFWPWVQVVRAYIQAADPAVLRREMGAGAADIAQIVPAVGKCLPDLPTPPPVEPDAARFRLFDSLAGFLRAAAVRRPLLLVLAGRLGHGGGGATTLRVFASFVAAADRRAAEVLGQRHRPPNTDS